MVEIFSGRKLKVTSLPGDDDLLVCIRGEKGNLLLITELEMYLKALMVARENEVAEERTRAKR